MKFNLKLTGTIPILFFLASCSIDNKADELTPQKGLVQFKVKQEVGEVAVPEDLVLRIKTTTGQPISEYNRPSEFPSSGIQLTPGDYILAAAQGKQKTPAFDSPFFEGTSNFKITANTTTNVSLSLKQTNFCIGIAYSDKFKSSNTSYSTTIESPDGSITYSGTEVRLGYFFNGPLTIKVSYTDSKGIKQVSTHTIAQNSQSILPASKLLLTVKTPNEGTGETGGNYTGYYQNASGKTGSDLMSALTTIISSGYKTQSYDALYSAYKMGDIRTDGTNAIWDVYSDKPGSTPAYYFQPDQDRCGTYKNEGDCFNREHCIPQSWFKEASPMVSDYLHILPTDGKVNGMRSNYPFGEVANASFTSTNGSKLGTPKSDINYSNTVFEPIDAYKGDIARIYFYFVTRYADKLSSFEGNGNEIFDSKTYLGLDKWTINLFLKWSKNDPVSDKERKRNETAQAHQNNRNPYVDHPEFIDMIWGSSSKSKSVTTKAGFKYIYIQTK